MTHQKDSLKGIFLIFQELQIPITSTVQRTSAGTFNPPVQL